MNETEEFTTPHLVGQVMPWDDPANPPKGACVISYDGVPKSAEILIPIVGGTHWLECGQWFGCN